jgi:hypothetical protein
LSSQLKEMVCMCLSIYSTENRRSILSTFVSIVEAIASISMMGRYMVLETHRYPLSAYKMAAD